MPWICVEDADMQHEHRHNRMPAAKRRRKHQLWRVRWDQTAATHTTGDIDIGRLWRESGLELWGGKCTHWPSKKQGGHVSLTTFTKQWCPIISWEKVGTILDRNRRCRSSCAHAQHLAETRCHLLTVPVAAAWMHATCNWWGELEAFGWWLLCMCVIQRF